MSVSEVKKFMWYKFVGIGADKAFRFFQNGEKVQPIIEEYLRRTRVTEAADACGNSKDPWKETAEAYGLSSDALEEGFAIFERYLTKYKATPVEIPDDFFFGPSDAEKTDDKD